MIRYLSLIFLVLSFSVGAHAAASCDLLVEPEDAAWYAGYDDLRVDGRVREIKDRLRAKGYDLFESHGVFLSRQKSSSRDLDTVAFRGVDKDRVRYVLAMWPRDRRVSPRGPDLVTEIDFAIAKRSDRCEYNQGWRETWCEITSVRRSSRLPVIAKEKVDSLWGPQYRETRLPFTREQIMQMVEELPSCVSRR